MTQAAVATAGYDQIILQAAGMGNLELNPFLPLIADALLTEIDLLTRACDVFARSASTASKPTANAVANTSTPPRPLPRHSSTSSATRKHNNWQPKLWQKASPSDRSSSRKHPSQKPTSTPS